MVHLTCSLSGEHPRYSQILHLYLLQINENAQCAILLIETFQEKKKKQLYKRMGLLYLCILVGYFDYICFEEACMCCYFFIQLLVDVGSALQYSWDIESYNETCSKCSHIFMPLLT